MEYPEPHAMLQTQEMRQRPFAEWWRPDIARQRRDRSGTIAVEGSGPRESALPFWGLMTFTFILLLAPQTFFPVLAPVRIALCTAAVATAAYLCDRFIRRQPVTILTREMRLTAGLAGWAIVTLPLSYWPGGSLAFLLGVYGKTLVVFWLLCNTVTSRRRLRQVAWGLSLMSAPLAATGVKHFLSASFLSPGDAVKRIVGYEAPLTENPNDLALMLNLILPFSLALFLMHRQRGVRALLLSIMLLNVMAVILTFSRAGFLTLAMIVGMCLWKLRRRPERVWAAAALALGILCVPFLPSGYVERVGTIMDINADPTGSAQARWNDTLAALHFVARNPIIGSGVGANVLALNAERGEAWKAVHNAYLEYAVELGIPGLVLFLLLLVGCITSATGVRQRSAPLPAFRDLSCLAEGIQISLSGFAVAALFHPVGYQFYFYYLAGFAVATRAVFQAEMRQVIPCQNPLAPGREGSTPRDGDSRILDWHGCGSLGGRFGR